MITFFHVRVHCQTMGVKRVKYSNIYHDVMVKTYNGTIMYTLMTAVALHWFNHTKQISSMTNVHCLSIELGQFDMFKL